MSIEFQDDKGSYFITMFGSFFFLPQCLQVWYGRYGMAVLQTGHGHEGLKVGTAQGCQLSKRE